MQRKIKSSLMFLGFIAALTILAACGGGGSGGGGETVPASYTGETGQAVITTANVSALTSDAWDWTDSSQDLQYSLPDSFDSGTVPGNCGGSLTLTLNLDSGTGHFSGDFTFDGYCQYGTTINGTVPISGDTDSSSGAVTYLKLSFDKGLDISTNSLSYSLAEGYESYQLKQDENGEIDKIDLVVRDNSTSKTYWLRNLTADITYGSSEDTITLEGTFYDYDAGYVEISTPTPLVITYTGPTGGTLMFSGKESSAKMTFLADQSTLLSLDENGDGNYVPIGLTFIRQYLQFRTYENAASNRYAAWIDYKRNGTGLLPAGALSTARIYDSSGTLLSAQLQYISNPYVVATWDAGLAQFTNIGIDGDSGFALDLGYTHDLAPGNYTIEVETSAGDVLSSTLDYPGKIALQPVASSSMLAQWNLDGSLTLSWSEPADSFQAYRVVFYDQDGLNIFFGRFGPGITQVTLQADLVAQIWQLASPTQVRWVMQTRDYVGDDNYARSYSNAIPIWP